MRDVDALVQTVNVKWIAPAGSDTVSYGSDPKFETVSAYEQGHTKIFEACEI